MKVEKITKYTPKRVKKYLKKLRNKAIRKGHNPKQYIGWAD